MKTTVSLTTAQWDLITQTLLDSMEKPLVKLAKDIQLQVYDPLAEWKENLRRNGLNV